MLEQNFNEFHGLNWPDGLAEVMRGEYLTRLPHRAKYCAWPDVHLCHRADDAPHQVAFLALAFEDREHRPAVHVDRGGIRDGNQECAPEFQSTPKPEDPGDGAVT